MFYELITRRRDEWLRSESCTVRELVGYIVSRGMMRDAQIDAIRTFLYLKVACHNRPLWQLFTDGSLRADTDFDTIPLSVEARRVLTTSPAAAALFEYARLHNRKGRQQAPQLEQFIKDAPEATDYEQAFRDIFYGVTYPDYVFSLPMGAGKTFLMAAFIYLELYLSLLEPDNPAFAHNFMILAPSGLKTSIVPSIRHIQDFDPTWVLPDPVATQLRREICFEVLDEQKTAARSNLIKNPNAQKINSHQPLSDLRGLVAVTNAEKVILDKLDKEKGADLTLYSREELAAMKQSNELRAIISYIPHLSIFIDEVHHASDGDIRLRQVVNGWTDTDNFNSVLGFSGTPYLAKAETVTLGGQFDISTQSLSNVVYDYPLIEGVGNFLKRPTIKTTNNQPEAIVREGVEMFLDLYGDKVYANGACAKMAIYCSNIANLEENIYPLVCQLLAARGLDPAASVLRFHGGNATYPTPAGAATEFASLDASISRIRVILLAQIGKEGWDCKSLTGVILPQKGVCPKNMVLQTSCRCLRQVVRGDSEEHALIWLNEDNATMLNNELRRQQNTSIDELNRAGDSKLKRIDRYVRRDVPPIEVFQLKIHYDTLITEGADDPARHLNAQAILEASPMQTVVTGEQDLEGNVREQIIDTYIDDDELAPVTFNTWLLRTSKEGMHQMPMARLRDFEPQLRQLFALDTFEADGLRYLRRDIDQKRVRALVRQAFSPRRDISVRRETIREQASILVVDALTTPLHVADDSLYYPDQQSVSTIIKADNDPQPATQADDQLEATIAALRSQGLPGVEAIIAQLRASAATRQRNNEVKDKTYHYLPYHFDSGFERDYFAQQLLADIASRQLEVYFNGDETLTRFRIRCYHRRGDGDWRPIGNYYPDFLVLQRDAKADIHRVLIIETKGEGFAAKFAPRRQFMENEFLQLQNEAFGYRRFDFLYIEDTLSPNERTVRTLTRIKQFFETSWP